MEDRDVRHEIQQWARSPDELSLIRLEQIQQMLAEEVRLDPVRELRDMAAAARVYARQRGMSLSAQNMAAEIRLRAERRMGEILATKPKNRGARGNPGGRGAKVERRPDDPPTLADLGIEVHEANRMRWLSRIPEERLQNALQSFRQGAGELTEAALRRAILSDPAASGAGVGEEPPIPTPETEARWVREEMCRNLNRALTSVRTVEGSPACPDWAAAKLRTAVQLIEEASDVIERGE